MDSTVDRRQQLEHQARKFRVRCLPSHKCDDATHALIEDRLRPAFSRQSVDLIRDPFGEGESVERRIETLDVSAVVFLSTPASCCSEACKKELLDAAERGIPVFVVRLAGKVPAPLRGRIYADVGASGAVEEDALERLAASTAVRGRLYRKLSRLATLRVEIRRATAQAIADEHDVTALAEFVPHMVAHYGREDDELTRGLTAEALGKAGTPAAVDALRRLLEREGEPLPRLCIETALRTSVRR